MLRSPSTSSNATIVFSGSLTSSIRLEVLQDGSVAFIGSNGVLLGVADSLSGSLFAVNDISGFPILEVFSDDRVVMGAYNQNTLIVTGSNIGVRKTTPTLGFALDISGSVAITGSLNVSSGITGSLLGTSSYAITASYAFSALTASYALNAAGGGGGGSGVISSSFQLTNGQGFAFDTASNVTFGQVTASAVLISGSGILMPSGSLFMGDTNNAKFVVGSNTAETIFGQADLFQVLGTGATVGFVGRYSNNANGPRWGLAKSRSTTVGGRGAVQDGDSLGRFVWFADNGTILNESVTIEAKNIGGDVTTNLITFSPGNDGPVLELYYSSTLKGAKISASLDVQTSVKANSITASFIDINKPLGGDTSFVLDVSGSSAFTGSVFITGSLVVSGTFENMSGSVNFIPKFASSSILRPSNIVDNGTSVGFFKTAPTAKVDINGQTIITGSLDIVIDGAAGWNRFIVTSSRMWGDSSAYVTIGSGSSGIMINNPHIVWNSGNAAAGLRLGRSSGTSTGAWYEVAVGASDDFFIAKNGGRNNAQLYINTAGNMSLGKATASVRLDVNGNVLVSGSTRSPHFSVEPYLGSNPIISFTGSAGSSSIRLETLSDGSIAFIGSSGTLFGVTDSLTGSLMSVSDITGLPIFEVFSNDTIVAGKYGAPAMIISGSNMIATGSLLGTASYALNALTASYALNAAGGGGGSALISSSFQLTNGQGFAFTTQSNVTFGQVTASFIDINKPFGGDPAFVLDVSGSSAFTGSVFVSGSLTMTGSINTNTLTSSFIMLRSPNTSSNASIVFSGSLTSSIRMEVLQDGGVSFIGSSGTLFGISDSLSGSLMSVNDISGMPIFEVFSDERVVMGAYNQNVLVVTGSDIGIGKANPNLAFILDVSGSVAITGSLNVSAGITGSLLGTASYALNALTASYALNAAGGSGVISSSFQLTNGQGFAFNTGSNVTFGQITSSAILFSNNTASIRLTVSSSGRVAFVGNTAGEILGMTDDASVPAYDFDVTGTARVTNGITGDLTGTSSFAVTASYAIKSKSINGLGASIDGGGDTITSGIHTFIEVPLDCTINSWRILADQVGSISIDIWKCTYATYPPTSSDSMPGTSSIPAISNAIKAESTNLTGWNSVSLTQGDILSFYVTEQSTNITKATLQLFVTQ
jgi:hypothetical protein